MQKWVQAHSTNPSAGWSVQHKAANPWGLNVYTPIRCIWELELLPEFNRQSFSCLFRELFFSGFFLAKSIVAQLKMRKLNQHFASRVAQKKIHLHHRCSEVHETQSNWTDIEVYSCNWTQSLLSLVQLIDGMNEWISPFGPTSGCYTNDFVHKSALFLSLLVSARPNKKSIWLNSLWHIMASDERTRILVNDLN